MFNVSIKIFYRKGEKSWWVRVLVKLLKGFAMPVKLAFPILLFTIINQISNFHFGFNDGESSINNVVASHYLMQTIASNYYNLCWFSPASLKYLKTYKPL